MFISCFQFVALIIFILSLIEPTQTAKYTSLASHVKLMQISRNRQLNTNKIQNQEQTFSLADHKARYAVNQNKAHKQKVNRFSLQPTQYNSFIQSTKPVVHGKSSTDRLNYQKQKSKVSGQKILHSNEQALVNNQKFQQRRQRVNEFKEQHKLGDQNLMKSDKKYQNKQINDMMFVSKLQKEKVNSGVKGFKQVQQTKGMAQVLLEKVVKKGQNEGKTSEEMQVSEGEGKKTGGQDSQKVQNTVQSCCSNCCGPNSGEAQSGSWGPLQSGSKKNKGKAQLQMSSECAGCNCWICPVQEDQKAEDQEDGQDSTVKFFKH